jgi:hypothetical protein
MRTIDSNCGIIRVNPRRSSILLAAITGAVLLGSTTVSRAQIDSAAERERAITDRYLTTVHTELTGKLDTRSAKPGQEVAVRLTEEARLADGTTLPKGSRLVGRIGIAQAQGSEQPAALLVLTFDHADIKGRILLVRSVIQMVTPASGPQSGAMDARAMGGMQSNPFPDNGDTGMSTGGGNRGTLGGIGTRTSIDPRGTGSNVPLNSGPINGDPMGNGTIAGASNQSNVGVNGSQGGGVYAGGSPSVNGPVTAGGPIGSRPIDSLGNLPTTGGATTVRPVVSAGENVSGGARMTGVAGVMLSRNGAPDASGVLSAMGRNIVLESGTRITLGVISR